MGYLPEINNEPPTLRHGFYSSKAISSACDKIQRAQSLASRLFEMINRFGTKTGDIKITPSNLSHKLSERSIPFYYDISETLLKSWDFDKTKRFISDTNLCYYRDQLASDAHIQEPLNYNIDSFDFYRIRITSYNVCYTKLLRLAGFGPVIGVLNGLQVQQESGSTERQDPLTGRVRSSHWPNHLLPDFLRY